MAKIYGLNGRYVGKMGGEVFSVNSGIQLSRAYNGRVKNPSTTRQVSARAKFKLLSQLSAALSNVIAMPRESMRTPRNIFMDKNYPLCTIEDGVASLPYESLQLTKGSVILPRVTATRSTEDGVQLALEESAATIVDRVIYCVFKKTEGEQLMFVSSVVVEETGNDGTFPISLTDPNGELVVYAYGMKDTSADASARYANYHVATGEDIANLIATRTITESDARFTATTGATIPAGDTPTPSPEPVWDDNVKINGENFEISGLTLEYTGNEKNVILTGQNLLAASPYLQAGSSHFEPTSQSDSLVYFDLTGTWPNGAPLGNYLVVYKNQDDTHAWFTIHNS